jgi:Tfp pilus assembly protein PilV
MFLRTKKQKTKEGFSLVETVIYIGLMSVILFCLISLISSATRTYLFLKSSRNIERSAINVFDSLNDKTNVSSKIDIPNTVFDNASGSISLILYNGNTSITNRIYLSNGQVLWNKNGVLLGPLTLSDVRVTSLTFRNMTNSTFNGFKVEMTIDNGTSSEKYMSEDFYDSFILRN